MAHDEPEYLARARARAREAMNGEGGLNGAAPESKAAARPGCATLANFRIEEVEGTEGRKETVRIGLPLRTIRGDLVKQTGGWPKRVREMLFAQGPDCKPVWLLGTDALFAWTGDQLKTVGMAHPVAWVSGQDKVTQGQFYQHLVQTVENFEAVEPFPHWPGLPKHFYMHPPLQGGNGKALAWVLARFQAATDADSDLIKAMFLTTVWGGAPGTRPAFLIESDEDDQEGGRGAGKTKLAQACAHVVGGHIDARPGEEIGQFITRLLSPQARQWRVALLDNIKALRFSDAAIGALITSDTISGRQLYVGDGQRPNTLMWIFTLNGAALSKDLAQRCVIIRVRRGDRSPLWEPETWEFIDRNRLAIIGDIVAELKRPGRELRRFNPRTESRCDIIPADVAGSHGARPDLLILNELSHVGKQEFAENLMDNASKVPHGVVCVATNADFVPSWQWDWRENARTSSRWYFSSFVQPAPWLEPAEIAEAQRRNNPLRFARLWQGQWVRGTGDALDSASIAASVIHRGPLTASGIPHDLAPPWAHARVCHAAGWIPLVGGLDLGVSRDHSAACILCARAGKLRVAWVQSWAPPLHGKINLERVQSAVYTLHRQYRPLLWMASAPSRLNVRVAKPFDFGEPPLQQGGSDEQEVYRAAHGRGTGDLRSDHPEGNGQVGETAAGNDLAQGRRRRAGLG